MSEDSAILFSGVPTVPSPEVFENVRKSNPLWSQLLEAAYAKFAARPENVGIFADPKGKGATVEQVGLVLSTLTGLEMYCVLARTLPASQITRLTRVVQYLPEQVVETLKKIQSAEGYIGATTLHYDGRTGHCISVMEYDKERDRFIYYDPWPLKSLLCEENNMAGVDAQPERGKRWSITSKELERVVFVSFVFPHQWARLVGVDFDLMYDTWKESEFFKFFHLKLIAERSENGMNLRTFAPGPFKDSISLIVESKENGKIVRTSLLLNKEWMINNFPLALDLSKSFIISFAPSPDKEKYVEISRALSKLNDRQFLVAMKDKDPTESITIECIHAFMGSLESASINTDLGGLSFKNVAHGKEHLQEIEFKLL